VLVEGEQQAPHQVGLVAPVDGPAHPGPRNSFALLYFLFSASTTPGHQTPMQRSAGVSERCEWTLAASGLSIDRSCRPAPVSPCIAEDGSWIDQVPAFYGGFCSSSRGLR
jgi:hypothetical protein